MPTKHPYTASAGQLTSTFVQLRQSLPPQITAETLQKLGLAPKNESYVLNVLRFLDLLGEDGNVVEANKEVFYQPDPGFAKAIERLVKEKYADLFRHFGDDAWTAEKSKLVSYFRTTDSSSATVGNRQAGTFLTLAGLAGHGEIPVARPRGTNGDQNGRAGGSKPRRQTSRKSRVTPGATPGDDSSASARQFGLTVRIEVNLPENGDQEQYDRIFRSIRENLIDG